MPFANLQTRRWWWGLLAFAIAYPLLLFLWIAVKQPYGAFISKAGVYLAASLKNARVVRTEDDAERNTVWIRKGGYSPRGFRVVELELSLPISNYSFNVPLTWALVVALFPVLKWRKSILLEIALILVSVHLLYVFSLTGLQLYHAEVKAGFRPQDITALLFWEFLWAFTDNMIIRFEPFLVALYLYFRSREPG